MASNLAFVKHRLQLRLQGTVNVSGGSDVVVHWIEIAGGALDELTGARGGGVETPVSGVLRALGYETPGATVLRKFTEIKAGDLILEVDPEGFVTPLPNQPVSGVVANQRLYRTLLLRRAV